MASNKLKNLFLYILIAACCAWLVGFIYFANMINKMEADTRSKADAIVVLTGGRNRIKEGTEELERNNGKYLLISGVLEHITLEQILKTNDVKHADKNKIILDYKSDNTHENARETKKWIDKKGYKSFKMITSSYHMPRSLLEFRHVMPEIRIEPYPVFSDYVKRDKWWESPATTALIAVEYTKFLIIYAKLNLEF